MKPAVSVLAHSLGREISMPEGNHTAGRGRTWSKGRFGSPAPTTPICCGINSARGITHVAWQQSALAHGSQVRLSLRLLVRQRSPPPGGAGPIRPRQDLITVTTLSWFLWRLGRRSSPGPMAHRFVGRSRTRAICVACHCRTIIAALQASPLCQIRALTARRNLWARWIGVSRLEWAALRT